MANYHAHLFGDLAKLAGTGNERYLTGMSPVIQSQKISRVFCFGHQKVEDCLCHYQRIDKFVFCLSKK